MSSLLSWFLLTLFADSCFWGTGCGWDLCGPGTHLQEAAPGRALGCFQDDRKSRLLEKLAARTSANSVLYCVGLCLRLGYPLAGVEYEKECFCGTRIPSPEHAIQDSKCTMPCPSNSSLHCGGYLALDVYTTGLPSEIIRRTSWQSKGSARNVTLKPLPK